MPIPAPAESDKAPLEPFRRDTLFKALLEALSVRDREPAPLADAREMLSPPNNARLTAVPVTLVPPPDKLWVAAAAAPGPMIVIEEAPELKVMFAPAIRDTLLDVPFKEKLVATGTVGPMIVMLEAPEFRVMLFPATSETLPVVPLNVKLDAVVLAPVDPGTNSRGIWYCLFIY